MKIGSGRFAVAQQGSQQVKRMPGILVQKQTIVSIKLALDRMVPGGLSASIPLITSAGSLRVGNK